MTQCIFKHLVQISQIRGELLAKLADYKFYF